MAQQAVVRGALRVMAVVMLFMVAMVLIYRDQLARYRAKALCVTIANNGRLPDNVAPGFESAPTNGVRTLTYIRKGVLPMSGYRCSVRLQGGKVTEAAATHAWSF